MRFADPEPETLELPASAVEAVLTDRTRWVAVTAASNAVGTVPDLPGIVAAAHAAGARVYVDAVHAAPHRRLDVEALGCDALACSAYKWFGPHVGILWGRPEVLEELTPDKLRPSSDEVPDRWELGTLPFESLAGVRAAADYVLVRRLGGRPRARGRAARRRARRAGRHAARDRLRRRARPRADADVQRRAAAPPTRSPPRSPSGRSPSGRATTTRSSSSATSASSRTAPSAPASSTTTTRPTRNALLAAVSDLA